MPGARFWLCWEHRETRCDSQINCILCFPACLWPPPCSPSYQGGMSMAGKLLHGQPCRGLHVSSMGLEAGSTSQCRWNKAAGGEPMSVSCECQQRWPPLWLHVDTTSVAAPSGLRPRAASMEIHLGGAVSEEEAPAGSQGLRSQTQTLHYGWPLAE